MRGIVFTGFLRFVEDTFNYEKVDELILACNLSNNGVYTSGDDYPFEELVSMVVKLSAEYGNDVNRTLEEFGKYLLYPIIELYNKILINSKSQSLEKLDVLTFFSRLTDIHLKQVKKLYPTGTFPIFDVIERDERHIVMHYISDKNLEHFAKGLMESAGEFFKEPVNVNMKETKDKNKRVVVFDISLKE